MEGDMRMIGRYALIAALMLCGACSGNANLADSQTYWSNSQQMAAMNWDKSAAVTSAAKPSNSFLIMMR
jgi:ABC-type oligopeptide transport system substrate-binding subunit